MASNDPGRTLAAYHGLCSRICDCLHLEQDVTKAKQSKQEMEFDALSRWANDQKTKQKENTHVKNA